TATAAPRMGPTGRGGARGPAVLASRAAGPPPANTAAGGSSRRRPRGGAPPLANGSVRPAFRPRTTVLLLPLCVGGGAAVSAPPTRGALSSPGRPLTCRYGRRPIAAVRGSRVSVSQVRLAATTERKAAMPHNDP